MVIHTKQKAKLHTHEPKQAAIKGSNVYRKEVRQIVHSLKRDIEKWKRSILTKMELRKFRTTPIQYMYLCSQDYTGICFRYEDELDIKIFNKVISNLIEKYEFLRSQIIYENV